ncbi:MAG TPA: sigma-70 family RNA polymerase sigma factor [Pirellulaceae bacterium]|nr:sigma-70 family RNA polymerase sigma factor [Planctomycetales bacterium]MCB9940027.1 sigma-70 family RNA polymerase sigma factor [Planctomycetaceae bacterium]HRX78757.1 sigma-70 family RNA polymerase sigma factor [Pirellulaceae bacterium]
MLFYANGMTYTAGQGFAIFMKDLGNVPGGKTSEGDSGSTSRSLIRMLKLKQAHAWHRLAVLYGPVVLHWCRRAGLQQADADDVVQEVFRTVAQRVSDFRHESPGDTFRGWLWTITRNKLGDFIRRQRATTQPVGGTDAQLQMAALPDDDATLETVGRDDFGALYRRALDLIRVEFKPATWDSFWRVVVDEQSPADVANELGVSVNAVYVAKSRVLSRLREELGDL